MVNRKSLLVKVWSGKSSHLTSTAAGVGDGLAGDRAGDADVTVLGEPAADGEPDSAGFERLSPGAQADASVRRTAIASALVSCPPPMKWWDATPGYAAGSDADVLVGEPQSAKQQRHRRDRENSQHRRGLQPMQQGSSVVVEGGKAKRRVGQLELRSDEADEEPGRQDEAQQPCVRGRPEPA